MTAGTKTADAGAALSFDRLKGRALSLGAARAFDYGLQFLLPVVLVRCLDANTFGEYRLLWLAIATISIAHLGMPGTLYFFLPRSDPARKRIYILNTAAFLGVMGLIAAWVVSPWNPWLPDAIVPLARYGALLPVFVALWVTASLLDFLPTIEERVTWMARVTVALSLLRTVVLAVGAFLTGSLTVLIWLLLGLVVLKLAILFGYIARHHGLARPWLDRAAFTAQFRHAAPIGLGNALFGMRSQGDQWIAAYLFSLSSFAAFSIATVLGPVVNLFRQSVTEAFLPSMSRMQAAGDVRGMVQLNSRANLMVGTLLFPLLTFAFVFAEEIITVVYTSAYLEGAPVMRLMSVGFACMVVEMGSIVLLLREGHFAFRVSVVLLAISLALSWYCGSRFGLAGAAAGSVLCLYLDRLVMLTRIAKRVGIPLSQMQDWRKLAIALVFAALAAVFAWAMVDLYFAERNLIVRLAAGGLLLAAAYAAVPWLLGVARKEALP
jgi:O-antigen/teichoic acid export membrane protein